MRHRKANKSDLIIVYWQDIVQISEWLSNQERKNLDAALIKSVGFFVENRNNCLKLASTINEDNTSSDIIIIPWGCICYYNNINQNKEEFGGSFSQYYCGYKASAKFRQIPFDISKSEFLDITQQNCHYCNQKPNSLHGTDSKKVGFIGNGVDRLDSNGGYNIENCVPCCTMCNYMKSNTNVDAFIKHVHKIAEFSYLIKKEIK